MKDKGQPIGPAEQEESEVEQNTERLKSISQDLFSIGNNPSEWIVQIEALIKVGALTVESLDERNYHQISRFKGSTEIGDNPIIGKLQYGDNFHTGSGKPILVSFTCYLYGNGGTRETKAYSRSGNEGKYYYVLYRHEEVKADGSKSVREESNGQWTTTEYDAGGNEVKKE